MAANAQCAAARLQSAAPIGSRVSAPAAHAPASNRTESSVHASRNDDLGKRRIQTKTSGPRKPASLPLLSLKGQWICGECDKTCIVIREECRCLCGHRLKEHTKGVAAALEGATKFGCTNGKCGCRDFFYIVAEGAWILRCRCKHKHIEHDPISFRCTKTSCACSKFDSPWVCNCNHPWSVHKQVMAKATKPADASSRIGKDAVADLLELAGEVNNLDAVRRDPLAASVPLVAPGRLQSSSDLHRE